MSRSSVHTWFSSGREDIEETFERPLWRVMVEIKAGSVILKVKLL